MAGKEKVNTKDVGYIMVDKKIRIKVEADNLVIEQLTSEKDGNLVYGRANYFTSWSNVFSWLIRHFTTQKIAEKELWEWWEARQAIIDTTKEVEKILLSGIEEAYKISDDIIKKAIKKM